MPASCILGVPKRYWITFLVFINEFLAALRGTNMTIAIDEMRHEDYDDNSWDSSLVFLSRFSFNYGLFLSFLGACLIPTFGGVKIIGIGTVITGALDILSPFLINIHWLLMILCRFIQGVIMGIVTCSDVDIFARWSPMSQRTRLLTIASLGGIIAPFVTYYLIYWSIAEILGWQAIFYTTGIASLIWSLIWSNTVSNHPTDDKFVQDAERNLLVPKKGEINNAKLPIPWRQILSSKSVYAVFIEHFTGSLVPAFISRYLIIYIIYNDHLGIRLISASIILSISTLCSIIAMLVAAFLSDYLRSHGIMKSKIHKNYHLYGEVVILLSLLALALSGTFTICIISVCCIQIACSFIQTSDLVLCIDMAGQHAAVIRSIGATLTFLGADVAGYLLTYSSNPNWNGYFLILSGISLFGVILFTISGPGELQSWASEAKPAEKEGEREINLGGNTSS